MTIPRRRLALTAGALVLLAAVGVDVFQAATTQTAVKMPAVANAPVDADAAAATEADNALLLDTSALLNDPTSSHATVPATLPGVRDRIEGRIARVRGHLVHATVTVLDRDGRLVTYQLDHGTVTAVGGGSITIAEAGGTNVTIATSTATRVRKDARPATLANLAAGDEVVVRSTVVGGSATARLVVVLPAGTVVAPPSGGDG